MARASRTATGGVFISYRHEDAGYASRLLADGLISRYGRKQVFLDVISIGFGDNFVEEITTAIDSCQVLLAVIDPNWVDSLNKRMSDGSTDYVRLEIETALERGLRVIPVRIAGAPVPDASQLPDSLSSLETINAYELRSNEFEHDLNRLLDALDSFLKPLAPQSETAENLAKIVRKQWRKETGLRGFHQGAQMLHVSWQPVTEGFEPWDDLITTAKDKPAAKPPDLGWASTSARLAGSDYQQICAVLDQIPTRRLVVLGQPGAGKTMLLIQLLQGLLDRRRPGDAVPVLVSLASWRPYLEDLDTWLDRRLAIDYPILRARGPGLKTSYGRAVLDELRILLLLDGLDEIPTEDRPEAIKMINDVLGGHPEGLVVACRAEEYLQAAEPPIDEPGRRAVALRAAAGIVLQPLEPSDVAGYLRRGAPNQRARAEWEPVTSKLGAGTAVGEALTTPLNVTLAHAIYNDPDWQRGAGSAVSPADLLEYPTAAKIVEHLYETFIKAAYRPEKGTRSPREKGEKPPPAPPALVDAHRWLIFLAQKPGLTWWDLPKSGSPWLAPLVIGLICGIVAALAGVTGAQDGVGIGVNLGTGLIAGLVFGLPFRFFRREPRSDPAGGGGARPVKTELVRGVAGGLLGGIIGGLAAGVAAPLGFGHAASLVSGLPVALGVGLGVGACTTFAGGIAGGLLGGFTGGALEGVGPGLPAGVVNGIGITLVVALVVGLMGRDTPAAKRRWSWPMGLCGGLVLGAAVGIIAGFWESPAIGLILGAAVGATGAWPTGLVGIMAGHEEIASPQAALSRDVRAFWTTALSAGTAAAAFAFAGDGMVSIFEMTKAKFSFALLVKDGLGVGLSAGIIVGLVFGAYHATSPSFLIARIWLSLSGNLPWRFMTFLADAHMHRGVLRENGAVYEFRHLEIKNYLARVGAEEAAKRKPRRPAPARSYNWRPRTLRSSVKSAAGSPRPGQAMPSSSLRSRVPGRLNRSCQHNCLTSISCHCGSGTNVPRTST